MAFIKVKIAPKLIPTKKVVESTLQRVSREMDEKEAKKIKDEKDKIKDDQNEKKRQAVIIRPYLDNLRAQIQEKDIQDFWTFTDRKGFKKFRATYGEVKQLLKSDKKRFQNRRIAYLTIAFHQDEKETTMHRKNDIWLGVSFCIWQVDEDCNMTNPTFPSTGGHVCWKSDDFKTTKFSLKLIEKIMNIVNDNKAAYTSLLGLPITWIVDDLKTKKKIDISKYLNPLADV